MRWFSALAVGNGVAAGLSLAAALRGNWLLTAVCVAASLVFASAMLRRIPHLQQTRKRGIPALDL